MILAVAPSVQGMLSRAVFKNFFFICSFQQLYIMYIRCDFLSLVGVAELCESLGYCFDPVLKKNQPVFHKYFFSPPFCLFSENSNCMCVRSLYTIPQVTEVLF